GYLDEQSFDGKVIGGVQALCAEAGTPIAAIVGDSAPDVVDRITHRSLAQEFGLDRAMKEPLWCIEHAASSLLRELFT
ncbi:MAG TPA: glycerate kinase, partial [Ilumatobacteraceae bacterium]|nr:glycerate kinase [Ilumatobacteraceae bacterium]